MTQVKIKVPLTEKEGEAIMWCLGQIVNFPRRVTHDKSDPLYVLLAEGHPRAAIMRTADAMFQIAYGDWLETPFTPLQQAILRVCVENTSWVGVYRSNAPVLADQALATLRSLATKLDALGIVVNHIPNE